jgi:hypothetical protein
VESIRTLSFMVREFDKLNWIFYDKSTTKKLWISQNYCINKILPFSIDMEICGNSYPT